MAAAAGLHLVPPDRRDPTKTTTYGVGELIAAALSAGSQRIILGIGGSSTTDGGTGCAQALGVRFVAGSGQPLPTPMAGGQLPDIARIDRAARDGRLDACELLVACDVDNPLTGAQGAAHVYGPQKGATADQVRTLDAGLAHLGQLIERDLGLHVVEMPGAGAAGGLGAGLVAFCGATLRAGIGIVTEALGLTRRLAGADLTITGEGRIDHQSMRGKVIAGVGAAAQVAGVPCVGLCGARGDGADDCLALLESYHAIADDVDDPAESFRNAAALLASAAERIMRKRPA
jgi:glycerate kinase